MAMPDLERLSIDGCPLADRAAKQLFDRVKAPELAPKEFVALLVDVIDLALAELLEALMEVGLDMLDCCPSLEELVVLERLEECWRPLLVPGHLMWSIFFVKW